MAPWRHLRFALRQVRVHPVLSSAVVLTLGLGLGANTAIFSFVNALLIRPFPFRDPDRLVEIHSVRGGQAGKLSMREVLDLSERVGGIESIAAHTGAGGGYNYGGDGRPEEWRAILTTGNLFEVLGVPLAHGHPRPVLDDRQREGATSRIGVESGAKRSSVLRPPFRRQGGSEPPLGRGPYRTFLYLLPRRF